MRDRHEIEKEMFHAREDLEQNLGELRDTLREKVDLPNRVRRVAFVRKKQLVIAAGVALGLVAAVMFLRYRATSR